MDLSSPRVSVALVLVSVVTVLVLVSMMGLFGGNQMPVEGKTILLTGASEGLGLSAAKQLAAKGANIILVARNVQKLQSTIEDVKAAARNSKTQRFHYISADVTVPNYATAVLEEAATWNGGQSPDIVWCVAGSANIDLFLNVTTTELRRQMDLNYFGQVEMAHAILREWLSPDAPVEAEARHLILTATTACFLGVPGYSIYGPAKAGIRYVADCLSHEIALYPQNVKVHVIFPGNMLSPGFERENVNKPEITKIIEETDPRQEPDDAAAQAIKGLENGQYFCTLNWLGAIMRWGGLGSSMRVNWISDTLGAVGMSLGWPIYLFDLRRTINNYAKKNGHPATLRKQNA